VIPTPATGYLLAAAFVLGMGIGGTAAYKIEHGAVLAQKLAIAEANQKAAAVLATEKEKVAKAENNARLANKEIDELNEKNIQSVKTAHDELVRIIASRGLRNNADKASGTNALSESNNPGQHPEDETSTAFFTRGLNEVVVPDAQRADELIAERNTLLEFVKNNCGMVK
jgi:hypothetical protein